MKISASAGSVDDVAIYAPDKTLTPSAMAGRDCAFIPQGLHFLILNLNSTHAEATCMVEKTCLYRSVDIDCHNNVWRPKNIF